MPPPLGFKPLQSHTREACLGYELETDTRPLPALPTSTPNHAFRFFLFPLGTKWSHFPSFANSSHTFCDWLLFMFLCLSPRYSSSLRKESCLWVPQCESGHALARSRVTVLGDYSLSRFPLWNFRLIQTHLPRPGLNISDQVRL